ncbi:MAG: hypothetical protein COV73_01015 [Candidatus Omnitrophica bacterium CG11_big_fil_rev_8_21_14_0_20_43_6]|nr:MAG: hypothetical protein COV73_01015 [Candidatus Omnitrophica bacterium CG11_big_fil_rev_8_21_14_0_20_43_6]
MKLTRKGFSLIETMFSVFILLVIIIAAVLAITSATFLIGSSRNLVTASNDAQYILEQIKAQSFSDIPAYIASYPTETFDNLPDEEISFPSPVYTSTLDTITVQMDWNERNAAQTYSITTRLAQ